ncbi:HipA domain-containing protein [Arthrobacter sp. HS15c]|uniref:HipA domain-containing protein n=1 Tax=Arthrobacter sp. HS15c TaxID=3230279 RepID=UPI003467B1CD
MATGLRAPLESLSEPIFKRQKAMELIPNLLVAEEWALRVARTAGLPAVDAHLAADELLAVTRFDYPYEGKWLHHEDFGQALGLDSARACTMFR